MLMFWRLLGANPLCEPMLTYWQLESQEQTSMKSETKHKIFIQDDAFENAVWKSQPFCVGLNMLVGNISHASREGPEFIGTRGNPNMYLYRLPVNSPQKGQWHGALMFSLISWTIGWVNNRDAGDVKDHRAHYDVTIVTYQSPKEEHCCRLWQPKTISTHGY